MIIKLTDKLLARFWSKVDKQEFHWIWIGGLFNNGYGIFHLNGKMYGAHVISFLIEHKFIPKEFNILHKPECNTLY